MCLYDKTREEKDRIESNRKKTEKLEIDMFLLLTKNKQTI